MTPSIDKKAKPIGRRIWWAITVQIVMMALVLVQPLRVIATGTEVWLETEKMDPRALFRGDYVILGYTLAQGILTSPHWRHSKQGAAVYVTIITDRPAKFVAVEVEPPVLQDGQACLIGRVRGHRGKAVDFPQIAQYFVPEGTGKALEGARGKDLLARARTAPNCKAVLLGLEPR